MEAKEENPSSSSPPSFPTLVPDHLPFPLALLALVAEVLCPRGHQAAQLVSEVGESYCDTRGEEVEEAEGKAADKEEKETS